MSGPSQRTFGPAAKALSSLSDRELRAEVQRRRARRAGLADGTEAPGKGSEARHGPAPVPPPLNRQVRQWLANLELADDASLADVETAYGQLVERYGPAAQDTDAQRRATARALLASLKQAHEGLRLHFSRTR